MKPTEIIKPQNRFFDNTKKIKIPVYSEELAEFIGILLGDGNICSFIKGKKNRTYSVRIAGDSRNDYTYLTKFVAPLCKNLFGITPKFYKSKRCNAFYVRLDGLRLIEYLSTMGLKSGNKLKNQSTIPKWIWSNNKYLRSCVRGLIDTDGSIYELLPNWPGCMQIMFKNYDKTLLEDTRKAFLLLGFKISNISMGNKIYLTRKLDIDKFYKEVGFSNLKHILRYKKIKNHSPVV